MLREHSNSTCYRKVRFYFVQLLYVPDQLPPLIGHNYIYTIWIHMSGALSASPLQKKNMFPYIDLEVLEHFLDTTVFHLL